MGNVSCHESHETLLFPLDDEWHVNVTLTSGVMPLLHQYFLKILQKSVIMLALLCLHYLSE